MACWLFFKQTRFFLTYTELSVLLSSLKVRKAEGQIFLNASNRNKQSFDIQLLDPETGSSDLFLLEEPSLESSLESEDFFRKEDLLNSLNQIKKEYDKQVALSTLLVPKYDHLASLISIHIEAFQITDEFISLTDTFNPACKSYLQTSLDTLNKED